MTRTTIWQHKGVDSSLHPSGPSLTQVLRVAVQLPGLLPSKTSGRITCAPKWTAGGLCCLLCPNASFQAPTSPGRRCIASTTPSLWIPRAGSLPIPHTRPTDTAASTIATCPRSRCWTGGGGRLRPSGEKFQSRVTFDTKCLASYPPPRSFANRLMPADGS